MSGWVNQSKYILNDADDCNEKIRGILNKTEIFPAYWKTACDLDF